jgi:hypothetical protein
MFLVEICGRIVYCEFKFYTSFLGFFYYHVTRKKTWSSQSKIIHNFLSNFDIDQCDDNF